MRDAGAASSQQEKGEDGRAALTCCNQTRTVIELSERSEEAYDLDHQPLTSADAAGYIRYAMGPLHPVTPEASGWLFAAGELAMTARDLALWDAGLINGSVLSPQFKARKEFSSGVVEGMNNKAKVTMRRSYGFRTFRVLELALYHSLGKLPEPTLTHEFF